jgi:hypothetical protein
MKKPRQNLIRYNMMGEGGTSMGKKIFGWLLFACCIACSSCTGDVSFGEYVESPDGRFKAAGFVCHNNWRSWCTMEVVENATSKRIYYLEQPIDSTDQPPMFDSGNALNNGIEWASDSSSVTFEGKNGELFVVPVPSD